MELRKEYLTLEDLKNIRGEIDMVMDQIEMTNQRLDNLRDMVQVVFAKLETMTAREVLGEAK